MRTTFIALLACVVAPALVESAQHGVRAADPKKTFLLVEEESSPDGSSKENDGDGATETINSKKTSDFSVEAPPAALAVAPVRRMMLSLVEEESLRKGRTNGDTSSEESESESSSDSITKKKRRKKRKRRGKKSRTDSKTTTDDNTRTPSPTPEPTPEPTPVPTPKPTPLNSDPEAVDDVATTEQDTSVFIDVLANDSDPDGDPLAIFFAFTGPQQSENGGTVEIVDGQIKYTPYPGFSGDDRFIYGVSDGKGGSSPSATVSITVNAPSNSDPEANDDIATTDENTPVLIDVLANDSDPDGDPLTIGFTDSEEGGIVVMVLVNGQPQLKYTPYPGFFGIDSFPYSVSDGMGGNTPFATVYITVNAMPTPPPTSAPTATP